MVASVPGCSVMDVLVLTTECHLGHGPAAYHRYPSGHAYCRTCRSERQRASRVAAGLPVRTGSEVERFWAKVERSDGCWTWTAAKHEGYGRFGVKRTDAPHGWASVSAHRYAYELLAGPIPDGLQLDHLCRNPSCGCVLVPGGAVRRGRVSGGERLTPQQVDPARHRLQVRRVHENTMVSRRNQRSCRACARERKAAELASTLGLPTRRCPDCGEMYRSRPAHLRWRHQGQPCAVTVAGLLGPENRLVLETMA